MKGDPVKLRHHKLMLHSPTMIVKDIVKMTTRMPDGDSIHLLGIRCFWFDSKLEYTEHLFNTKDLIKINETV